MINDLSAATSPLFAFLFISKRLEFISYGTCPLKLNDYRNRTRSRMWANIYVISVLYVIGTSAAWINKIDIENYKRNLLGHKTTMVRKSDSDATDSYDAQSMNSDDDTYTMGLYQIESTDNDGDTTNSYDAAMSKVRREKETQSSENEDHEGENEDTKLSPIVTFDFEDQTCVKEGFFPNPEDCSKFYRCVRVGLTLVKYDFSCPLGTLWDNQKATCNFPDQIQNLGTCNCFENLNVAESARVEDSPTIGDLSKDRFTVVCPSDFQQHLKNCKLFNQCIVNNEMQGSVVMFGCLDGTIFDQERLLSVDVTNDCTKFDEQPGSITILHRANEVICPEEGQFSYSKFCTSEYFKCIRNEDGILEGYLVDCPIGNVYSSLSNYCVPPALYRHCTNYYQV